MNPFKIASGLLAGLLFGAGLALAGMTNPNKVLNFLDLSGTWDPSLVAVMASAIPVSALPFWLARRRGRPLFEPGFVLPTNRRLETRLIVGSALFGVGWGLGGYCPGPAVASLSQPSVGLVAFLIPMILGLLVSGRIAPGCLTHERANIRSARSMPAELPPILLTSRRRVRALRPTRRAPSQLHHGGSQGGCRRCAVRDGHPLNATSRFGTLLPAKLRPSSLSEGLRP